MWRAHDNTSNRYHYSVNYLWKSLPVISIHPQAKMLRASDLELKFGLMMSLMSYTVSLGMMVSFMHVYITCTTCRCKSFVT
jgi:hypothetical protein